MKKFIETVCFILITSNVVEAAQIEYDSFQSGILNERTGSVRINGERYNVTERPSFGGTTEMEVRNYNNTYRGSVDSFGYGTLRDYNGNSIQVKPY